MYKEKLKVYAEDLMEADVSKVTTSEKSIKAGGTMGGLAVNLCAEGNVAITKATTMELLTAENSTDTFVSVATVTIPVKTYKDGDELLSVVVPTTSKRLLKTKLTGADGNTGTVKATLEYLAR